MLFWFFLVNAGYEIVEEWVNVTKRFWCGINQYKKEYCGAFDVNSVTFIGDKRLQRKKRDHYEQRTSSQRALKF